LAKIGDKTMLQCVIDAARMVSDIDKVVVAIPAGQKIPFKGAEKFEGSELNVLCRYYYCAEKYAANRIIRITADCPALKPITIITAIGLYEAYNFPYLIYSPLNGLDVEVFSFEMLREAWKNSFDLYDLEHVTPYMKRKTKLSVDTKEDLEVVKAWIAGKGLVR